MRKRTAIVLGLGIAMVLAISFFILYPYVLMGPPLHLFSIQNRDGTDAHEVLVEIIDSEHQPIFTETIVVAPNEEISYPKPLWLKLTRSRGEYTFNVRVDNTFTETCTTEVDPWLEVLIALYARDPRSGEIRPLTITRVVV
ncbi:MAG: hypothetical protein EFT35_06320 [Methanophagales archaeon ANME-1-THS]|nr:MAG: hypothetical protein EFT35_06320 [Methanophagales archaeon ANME-1-THS]